MDDVNHSHTHSVDQWCFSIKLAIDTYRFLRKQVVQMNKHLPFNTDVFASWTLNIYIRAQALLFVWIMQFFASWPLLFVPSSIPLLSSPPSSPSSPASLDCMEDRIFGRSKEKQEQRERVKVSFNLILWVTWKLCFLICGRCPNQYLIIRGSYLFMGVIWGNHWGSGDSFLLLSAK